MTYAYSMDVPQSLEMYDKVRVEVEQQLGQPLADGCLMHLVTRTDDGFRVTEVWDSHEAVDRFGDEVMRPIIARVMGLPQTEVDQNPPPSQELDVHRLEMNTRASASA